MMHRIPALSKNDLLILNNFFGSFLHFRIFLQIHSCPEKA